MFLFPSLIQSGNAVISSKKKKRQDNVHNICKLIRKILEICQYFESVALISSFNTAYQISFSVAPINNIGKSH